MQGPRTLPTALHTCKGLAMALHLCKGLATLQRAFKGPYKGIARALHWASHQCKSLTPLPGPCTLARALHPGKSHAALQSPFHPCKGPARLHATALQGPCNGLARALLLARTLQSCKGLAPWQGPCKNVAKAICLWKSHLLQQVDSQRSNRFKGNASEGDSERYAICKRRIVTIVDPLRSALRRSIVSSAMQ